MERRPVTAFASALIPLLEANVDTDQITPARFLKASRPPGGYGEILFYDRRFSAAGEPRPGFALDRPELRGATVLLAGENFGCGSSRETAVWALAEHGIRAVISTSFGDIFRVNALKNGLLPVVVAAADHRRLAELAGGAPPARVTVDLAAQTVGLPDGDKVAFAFDAFYKECLLRGLDQMEYLLEKVPAIEAYETGRPARVRTLA